MRPEGGHFARLGDAGPLLDEQAREEYRQRADDCRAEIAEAVDAMILDARSGCAANSHSSRKSLDVRTGVGAACEWRPLRSSALGVRVRNNITAALTMIRRAEDGELVWRHLDGAIRTGTVCSYRPERPVCWVF